MQKPPIDHLLSAYEAAARVLHERIAEEFPPGTRLKNPATFNIYTIRAGSVNPDYIDTNLGPVHIREAATFERQ